MKVLTAPKFLSLNAIQSNLIAEVKGKCACFGSESQCFSLLFGKKIIAVLKVLYA